MITTTLPRWLDTFWCIIFYAIICKKISCNESVNARLVHKLSSFSPILIQCYLKFLNHHLFYDIYESLITYEVYILYNDSCEEKWRFVALRFPLEAFCVGHLNIYFNLDVCLCTFLTHQRVKSLVRFLSHSLITVINIRYKIYFNSTCHYILVHNFIPTIK